MSHRVFRERLATQIEDTLRRAREAQVLKHPSLVGLCRELVVEGLLQPLLPAEYGVGTGKIVDSTGRSSRQIDLVIYHRNSIPAVMWSPRDGTFPVEACRYAIEVKSRLRKHMIKDIHASAKQVLSLKERRRSLGKELLPTQIPYVLFAFESDSSCFERDLIKFWDMKGHKKFPKRLEKPDGPKNFMPPSDVNVICIATKGYAAYDKLIGDWVGHESDGSNEHIIAFLMGIVNTLLQWPSNPNDMLYGPYVCDRKLEGVKSFVVS